MREAIKESGLSREQISDRIKSIASVEGLGGGRGSTVSPDNLDAWCAEGKTNIIPVNLLPVFCHVVGDIMPLAILARPLGGEIVDGKEAMLLAWARCEFQARDLAKQRKRILSEIEGK